jgi:hypothetical protein
MRSPGSRAPRVGGAPAGRDSTGLIASMTMDMSRNPLLQHDIS